MSLQKTLARTAGTARMLALHAEDLEALRERRPGAFGQRERAEVERAERLLLEAASILYGLAVRLRREEEDNSAEALRRELFL